jgi:tryptophan 7-halogenase
VPDAADDRIRRIVIVGGGVAAWLAAATLARVLEREFCEIRVLETSASDHDAISLSTLPSFHRLTGLLGIAEPDLMRRTRATFRLGAQLVDWARPGIQYFHTFGSIGARLAATPFHQHWLKLRQIGEVEGIECFSIASTAARQGRFAPPVTDAGSVLSHYSYAYHFDAGLLEDYLRRYAEARGVVRVARELADVQLRSDDGFIDALKLDDGTALEADFFIDIAGARDRLAQAIGVSLIDWSNWLPCDRAVAVRCRAVDDPPPFSQSIAHSCGWQWHVPLQGSVDSGYVYSSRLTSDDEAMSSLSSHRPGEPVGSARTLGFTPGRPREFWTRNYLALAGGAIEPLETTGLHLVQTGVARLLTLFPVRRYSPEAVEEYNRLTILEHERIRDFLILHYKATERRGAPFWDYCRDMPIPDSLHERIELFRDSGRISLRDEEHFNEDSWLSVLLGQGIEPRTYDPLADMLDVAETRAAFGQALAVIRAGVDTLPTHRRFIDEHCRSPDE